MVNPKLRKTIIVLHISAVLYLLIALFFLVLYFLSRAEGSISLVMTITIAVFIIAMTIFIEIVIKNLKKKKFWAWVASIILCGLYIPSAFIILGIIGLFGLLDKETKSIYLP